MEMNGLSDNEREPCWLAARIDLLRRFQTVDTSLRTVLLCPTWCEADTLEQEQAWEALRRAFQRHVPVDLARYNPCSQLQPTTVARMRASDGVFMVVCEPSWLTIFGDSEERMRLQIERSINMIQDIHQCRANMVWNPNAGFDIPSRIVPILILMIAPKDGLFRPRWRELGWDTVIYCSLELQPLSEVAELVFNPRRWPPVREAVSSDSDSSYCAESDDDDHEGRRSHSANGDINGTSH